VHTVSSSAKVLVVDDDPVARRSVCRALQSVGYEILQAASAGEARKALDRGDIGVMVLDVVLPDMNGLELLRQLYGEHTDVDVVVLTGSPARWDRAEAFRCGASSYLRKPFDPFMLEGQVAAAQHAHRAKRLQRHQCSSLETSLRDVQGMLDRLPRQLAQHFTGAWDLRHVETGAHVRRMGAYSEVLALSLGFEPDDAITLGQVAMLHDIGKLAIPDAILAKPGKLTPEEFEVMKLHPAAGARMLADIEHPFLVRAAEVALRHHERWDGSGYPGGLIGEKCPYDARIVAVADVYDALGQPRCYKPGWSDDEIDAYFRKTSGTLFEPKIVDALLESRPRLVEIAARLPDPIVEGPLESGVLPKAVAVDEPAPPPAQAHR
jgi:response regulator RpfG family c-di-GMP phosphodiesterase